MIANKSFRLRQGVKRCLSVINGPSFTPKEWTTDQLLMRAVEKMPDCKQALFDLFATEFTGKTTRTNAASINTFQIIITKPVGTSALANAGRNIFAKYKVRFCQIFCSFYDNSNFVAI
jgi:hypothetical protein